MIALLISLLLAQAKPPPEKPQDKPPPEKRPTTVTLNGTYGHRFAADLSDGPGDVAVQTFKLSVDVLYRPSEIDFLRFNGWIEHARYDFSDDAQLVAGAEPFEDVRTFRLEPSFTHVFGEHWSGLAYGAVSASWEEDATIGDAIAVGFGAGPLYRVSPDLTLGLLFRIETRIEETPYVFPHPLIEWKIGERLWLKNEVKAGTGYLLAYGLDAASAAALETRVYYTLRRFRLDGGTVPSEGIVQEDRVTWDVGFRYQGHPRFSAALHIGLALWQQYTIEDEDGNNLDDVETDVAPLLSLVVGWTF